MPTCAHTWTHVDTDTLAHTCMHAHTTHLKMDILTLCQSHFQQSHPILQFLLRFGTEVDHRVSPSVQDQLKRVSFRSLHAGYIVHSELVLQFPLPLVIDKEVKLHLFICREQGTFTGVDCVHAGRGLLAYALSSVCVLSPVTVMDTVGPCMVHFWVTCKNGAFT